MFERGQRSVERGIGAVNAKHERSTVGDTTVTCTTEHCMEDGEVGSTAHVRDISSVT
jgi:hypothetical protein